MARGFNLTAELNLRGPANIGTIVADIRRQLGTVTADVTVRVNPAATQNINALNQSLNQLNATLRNTAAYAGASTTSIQNFTRAVQAAVTASTNLPNNMTNAATATNNLAQNCNQASRATNQITSEFQEFGRQAALAVRRFAALATVTSVIYGVSNAISSASKEFLDFNRELVRVSQVTDTSVKFLDGLVNRISSLSVGLGVSSKELIMVSSTLAQAGLTAKDTEKALQALALSALAPSFDSMNETVEGSIALMRQFGISAGDLEKALGSVNAVAAKFAVEASDIITAIQRTGGVFATSSKGVAEGTEALNQFIAVFTSVRATTRESAETIATGLRTIFTRIQRSDTIDALKAYGVSLTDLTGKFVGPFEAVKRLSEGLSQLDPRDLKFSRIVEELGGFRQIGKVIPLIQQLSVTQQAYAVAQKGQGSLVNDAATAQQALAVKIAKVREEFIAMVRSIGQSDGFQTFVNLSLNLASALIKITDSAKGALPALTAIAAIRGAGFVSQFATGFIGGLRRRHDGGPIQKFARGGYVPGSGDGDTVPAMLQPGEFVIRKRAVQTIGSNNLHRMNKYGSGGGVERDPKDTLEGYFKNSKFVNAGLLKKGMLPRGGSGRKEQAERMKDMKKLETSAPPVLYNSLSRGAFDSMATQVGLNKNPKFPPGTKYFDQEKYYDQEVAKISGKNFRLSGYLSTSKDHNKAKMFLDNPERYKDSWGSFMTIKTKPKAVGVDVVKQLQGRNVGGVKTDKLTGQTLYQKPPESEDEFVLRPNSSFRINSAKFARPGSNKNIWMDVQQFEDGGEAEIPKRTIRSLFSDQDVAAAAQRKGMSFEQLKAELEARHDTGFKDYKVPDWEIKKKYGLVPSAFNVGAYSGAAAARDKEKTAAFHNRKRYAKGGLAEAPLVDDITANVKGAILPNKIALEKILASGYGALDFDRTLKRTVGDTAYGKAKTSGQKSAVLDRYFKNSEARLSDAKNAKLTQFGRMLQGAIQSGQVNPANLSIISKSGRTPGLAEYINELFGIPIANMAFTSGQDKGPALDALRTKGPRASRVSRFVTGGEVTTKEKIAAARAQNMPTSLGLLRDIGGGVSTVGAAVLEPDRNNKGDISFDITQNELEAKVGQQLKNLPLPYEVSGKSNSKGVILPKTIKGKLSGLSDNTATSFNNALDNGIVSSINMAAKQISSDLRLPIGQIGDDTRESFLSGINTGTRGNLFEDILTLISGKFERAASRNFDFPDGVPSLKNGDFAGLPSKWIDAKASFDRAKRSSGEGSLKEKTFNEIKKDILGQKKKYIVDIPDTPTDAPTAAPTAAPMGTSQAGVLTAAQLLALRKNKTTARGGFSLPDANRILRQAKLPPVKAAQLTKISSLKGYDIPRYDENAAGGSITDTVPALLTPGEFVINKSAAKSIGLSRLHKLNHADKVKGFNKGGPVGVQRFATGGEAFDDPALDNQARRMAIEIMKTVGVSAKEALTQARQQVRDSLAGPSAPTTSMVPQQLTTPSGSRLTDDQKASTAIPVNRADIEQTRLERRAASKGADTTKVGTRGSQEAFEANAPNRAIGGANITAPQNTPYQIARTASSSVTLSSQQVNSILNRPQQQQPSGGWMNNVLRGGDIFGRTRAAAGSGTVAGDSGGDVGPSGGAAGGAGGAAGGGRRGLAGRLGSGLMSRMGNLGNAGMTMAFMGPMIGEGASKLIGGKQGAGVGGAAANFSAAFSVGSQFGPYGALVGALAGMVSAIDGYTHGIIQYEDEISKKKIDTESNKASKNIEALGKNPKNVAATQALVKNAQVIAAEEQTRMENAAKLRKPGMISNALNTTAEYASLGFYKRDATDETDLKRGGISRKKLDIAAEEAAINKTSQEALMSAISAKVSGGIDFKSAVSQVGGGNSDFVKQQIAEADAGAKAKLNQIEETRKVVTDPDLIKNLDDRRKAIINASFMEQTAILQATSAEQEKAKKAKLLAATMNQASVSIARTFSNMSQSLNVASLKISEASNNVEAILSGKSSLKTDFASQKAILENPGAFSEKERQGAVKQVSGFFGQDEKFVRGLSDFGSSAQDTISKIASAAQESGSGNAAEDISRSLTDQLIRTFGDNRITESIRKQISNSIASQTEKGDGIDPQKLIDEADGLKTLIDANKQALETTLKIYATVGEALNMYSDAVEKASELQNKVVERNAALANTLSGLNVKVKELFGRRVNVSERISGRMTEATIRAGVQPGQLNPVALSAQRDAFAQQQQIAKQNFDNAKKGDIANPAVIAQITKAAAALAEWNRKLVSSEQSIENLPGVIQSNIEDILNAVGQKIAERESMVQAGAGFSEKLVTSTPEELQGLNSTFNLLNSTLAGNITTFQNSAIAQKVYNDAIMSGSTTMEAMSAAQTAFANENKNAMSMFSEMIQISGLDKSNPDKARNMRADLLENFAKAQGMNVGNNPMFNQMIAALRAKPEDNPEIKNLMNMYEAQKKALIDATQAANQLLVDKQAQVLTTAGNAVVEALKGVTVKFDEAQLRMMGLNIQRPGNVMGRAEGGMVYASSGKFIPRGTDTVPAMLSPGEFVVNSRATKNNLPLLSAINRSGGGPVYLARGSIDPVMESVYSDLMDKPTGFESANKESLKGSPEPKVPRNGSAMAMREWKLRHARWYAAENNLPPNHRFVLNAAKDLATGPAPKPPRNGSATAMKEWKYRYARWYAAENNLPPNHRFVLNAAREYGIPVNSMGLPIRYSSGPTTNDPNFRPSSSPRAGRSGIPLPPTSGGSVLPANASRLERLAEKLFPTMRQTGSNVGTNWNIGERIANRISSMRQGAVNWAGGARRAVVGAATGPVGLGMGIQAASAGLRYAAAQAGAPEWAQGAIGFTGEAAAIGAQVTTGSSFLGRSVAGARMPPGPSGPVGGLILGELAIQAAYEATSAVIDNQNYVKRKKEETQSQMEAGVGGDPTGITRLGSNIVGNIFGTDASIFRPSTLIPVRGIPSAIGRTVTVGASGISSSYEAAETQRKIDIMNNVRDKEGNIINAEYTAYELSWAKRMAQVRIAKEKLLAVWNSSSDDSEKFQRLDDQEKDLQAERSSKTDKVGWFGATYEADNDLFKPGGTTNDVRLEARVAAEITERKAANAKEEKKEKTRQQDAANARQAAADDATAERTIKENEVKKQKAEEKENQEKAKYRYEVRRQSAIDNEKAAAEENQQRRKQYLDDKAEDRKYSKLAKNGPAAPAIIDRHRTDTEKVRGLQVEAAKETDPRRKAQLNKEIREAKTDVIRLNDKASRDPKTNELYTQKQLDTKWKAYERGEIKKQKVEATQAAKQKASLYLAVAKATGNVIPNTPEGLIRWKSRVIDKLQKKFFLSGRTSSDIDLLTRYNMPPEVAKALLRPMDSDLSDVIVDIMAQQSGRGGGYKYSTNDLKSLRMTESDIIAQREKLYKGDTQSKMDTQLKEEDRKRLNFEKEKTLQKTLRGSRSFENVATRALSANPQFRSMASNNLIKKLTAQGIIDPRGDDVTNASNLRLLGMENSASLLYPKVPGGNANLIPRAASNGGVIYASTGKLVNFAPKGTDTVPAMLTPGEFVVNARSTSQNLPLLKAINNSKGGMVHYLQYGGGLPDMPSVRSLRHSQEKGMKSYRAEQLTQANKESSNFTPQTRRYAKDIILNRNDYDIFNDNFIDNALQADPLIEEYRGQLAVAPDRNALAAQLYDKHYSRKRLLTNIIIAANNQRKVSTGADLSRVIHGKTLDEILNIQSVNAGIEIEAQYKILEILRPLADRYDTAPLSQAPPTPYRDKGGVIYASTGKLVNFAPKGTDTVPAMLTPGEFVVNARSTSQNLPLLKSINNSKGGMVSYLQKGGRPNEHSPLDISMPGDEGSAKRQGQRQRYESLDIDGGVIRSKKRPNIEAERWPHETIGGPLTDIINTRDPDNTPPPRPNRQGTTSAGAGQYAKINVTDFDTMIAAREELIQKLLPYTSSPAGAKKLISKSKSGENKNKNRIGFGGSLNYGVSNASQFPHLAGFSEWNNPDIDHGAFMSRDSAERKGLANTDNGIMFNRQQIQKGVVQHEMGHALQDISTRGGLERTQDMYEGKISDGHGKKTDISPNVNNYLTNRAGWSLVQKLHGGRTAYQTQMPAEEVFTNMIQYMDLVKESSQQDIDGAMYNDAETVSVDEFNTLYDNTLKLIMKSMGYKRGGIVYAQNGIEVPSTSYVPFKTPKLKASNDRRMQGERVQEEKQKAAMLDRLRKQLNTQLSPTGNRAMFELQQRLRTSGYLEGKEQRKDAVIDKEEYEQIRFALDMIDEYKRFQHSQIPVNNKFNTEAEQTRRRNTPQLPPPLPHLTPQSKQYGGVVYAEDGGYLGTALKYLKEAALQTESFAYGAAKSVVPTVAGAGAATLTSLSGPAAIGVGIGAGVLTAKAQENYLNAFAPGLNQYMNDRMNARPWASLGGSAIAGGLTRAGGNVTKIPELFKGSIGQRAASGVTGGALSVGMSALDGNVDSNDLMQAGRDAMVSSAIPGNLPSKARAPAPAPAQKPLSSREEAILKMVGTSTNLQEMISFLRVESASGNSNTPSESTYGQRLIEAAARDGGSIGENRSRFFMPENETSTPGQLAFYLKNRSKSLPEGQAQQDAPLDNLSDVIIKRLQLPRKEAEKYRLSHSNMSDHPLTQTSILTGTEFVFPKEVAQQAKQVDMKDLPFHLQMAARYPEMAESLGMKSSKYHSPQYGWARNIGSGIPVKNTLTDEKEIREFLIESFLKEDQFDKALDLQLLDTPGFKSRGGMVYASAGTLVPYQPKGTDTVPAMLTPGEFVVNAKSTSRNLPLLKSINRQNGGIVNYLEDGGEAKSRKQLREEEKARLRQQYQDNKLMKQESYYANSDRSVPARLSYPLADLHNRQQEKMNASGATNTTSSAGGSANSPGILELTMFKKAITGTTDLLDKLNKTLTTITNQPNGVSNTAGNGLNLDGLTAFTQKFGEFTVALGKINPIINMKGEHTVNVNINGIEAFKTMQQEFQNLVTVEIQKSMNALSANSEGSIPVQNIG